MTICAGKTCLREFRALELAVNDEAPSPLAAVAANEAQWHGAEIGG